MYIVVHKCVFLLNGGSGGGHRQGWVVRSMYLELLFRGVGLRARFLQPGSGTGPPVMLQPLFRMLIVQPSTRMGSGLQRALTKMP